MVTAKLSDTKVRLQACLSRAYPAAFSLSGCVDLLCFARPGLVFDACTDLPLKSLKPQAAGEVAALNRFYTTLSHDADRAYYGYKHVLRAAEAQAIEVLLVSDALFRYARSTCQPASDPAIKRACWLILAGPLP